MRIAAFLKGKGEREYKSLVDLLFGLQFNDRPAVPTSRTIYVYTGDLILSSAFRSRKRRSKAFL